jgi:hypothetical protein
VVAYQKAFPAILAINRHPRIGSHKPAHGKQSRLLPFITGELLVTQERAENILIKVQKSYRLRIQSGFNLSTMCFL